MSRAKALHDLEQEAAENSEHAILALADEFEESVGLYRKMSDGRMVEIHVKKIALIQAALRHYATV